MTDIEKKQEVLSQLRVGARAAENESDHIQDYFVETDQWKRVYSGEVDVVYGGKGSGKSAIYTLLSSRETDLFDQRILISAAEEIRGSTAFRDLIADPPPSEQSFVALWKLYCLVLIGATLREYGFPSKSGMKLIETLEKIGILPAPRRANLYNIFKATKNYIFSWIGKTPEAVEWELAIDPNTGVPLALKRRAEYSARDEESELQRLPTEDLLRLADEALNDEGYQLWLLFDRLDVAFLESPELERNALRALFRTYRDLESLGNVSLKLFVRDDIWNRITAGGFPEASHIEKTIHISWSSRSLLNLVMRRLLWNESLVDYLDLDAEKVLDDFDLQEETYYRIFPKQVDTGKNPSTFDWMVNRVSDGTGHTAPRELIHLLECIREAQNHRVERGDYELPEEKLFDRAVFKEALYQVSKVRIEQTLFAEFAHLEPYIKKLEAEKTEQDIESLCKIWGLSYEEVVSVAGELADIGFFEVQGRPPDATYWIPFLYRPALELVQGKAI